MILLEAKGIHKATLPFIRGETYYYGAANIQLVKATAEKILIELQKIYNLPDEGMFNQQMGEFIRELKEEVG